MNNVIFMVNLPEEKKPDRTMPYRYSYRSWDQYAATHGHQLFILEDRIWPESYMNANWHKLYVFDLLESNNIEYDKILIVDSDTIIHPKAPDIFRMVGDKFYGCHNDGSYEWVIRSMENYSAELFDGFMFPVEEYINSGVMITNKRHAYLFREILEFYNKNRDRVVACQEKYRTGTDQPIINFFIHLRGIDLELLPYSWNMQEMMRKEILDRDLTFVNFGWLYHFNGIHPNYKLANSNTSSVHQWMEFVYKKLYE